MFRKEIITDIEINASAGRVWELITDFQSFPVWNPLMLKISGDPVEGEKLKILVHLFLSTDMTVTPVIIRVRPEKELTWAGGAPIPGLLDGEHGLIIEPLHRGRVRLIQRELWTGLMVPVFMAWLGSEIRRGFEKMNEEVRVLAEQRPHRG